MIVKKHIEIVDGCDCNGHKEVVVYESSTIKSSEYNFKTTAFTIFFHNNVYDYCDVSIEDYQKFRDADSQGKSLNEIIKGKYEYKKRENLVK